MFSGCHRCPVLVLAICVVLTPTGGASSEEGRQEEATALDDVALTSAAALRARQRFTDSVTAARKEYEANYSGARDELEAELRQALKEETKRGDLDEALRIRSTVQIAEGLKRPPAIDRDGGSDVVYLAGVAERPLKLGPTGMCWGRVAMHGVVVKGKSYPKALGIHAVEHGEVGAEFSLDRRFKRFLGGVAINDTATEGSRTPLTFRVVGDGKTLWTSRPVQAAGAVQPFSVSVRNVRKLRLYVDCEGDAWSAQSVWIDPRLD